MKDRDCDFLKPAPPYRAHIIAEPPISTSTLVRVWQKSGMVSVAPRQRTRLTWADLIGVASIVAALAFSLGYYLAH